MTTISGAVGAGDSGPDGGRSSRLSSDVADLGPKKDATPPYGHDAHRRSTPHPTPHPTETLGLISLDWSGSSPCRDVPATAVQSDGTLLQPEAIACCLSGVVAGTSRTRAIRDGPDRKHHRLSRYRAVCAVAMDLARWLVSSDRGHHSGAGPERHRCRGRDDSVRHDAVGCSPRQWQRLRNGGRRPFRLDLRARSENTSLVQ
jgi:hypothetical protein